MDASNANTNQAAKSSRRSRWRRCQDDIADPRARSACMCSPRRPFPTGTAHRRSACSLSMHVLTTAPFPHRYCTSPIRVLARLSRRLTVTGSGEKTLSETRRGPRGGSQSWFAVGVASRYRPGRLAADVSEIKSEICGLKARMNENLRKASRNYHTISWPSAAKPPTLPPTLCG